MNHPLAALAAQFLKERTYLKNVTERTLVWYRVAFKNYLALVPEASSSLPTKATMQQFVVALRERGIKPVTCNTYVGAMNAFCSWLHQEGHAAARVKLDKLRVEQRLLVLLDDTQMRVLIGYRPKTFRQARVHVLTLVILDTGLRISETLNLRTSDIDFDNLVVRVFGKGQKERLVPFSPELRRRLFRFQQLRAKKGIPSEFLFSGFEGTRMEKRNATTSLYLMQDKLGLPRFGFHRLRHTFATEYLRHGGDVVRLSRILGHTQVTTTMRYVHLLTDDLKRGHQGLSVLRRMQ